MDADWPRPTAGIAVAGELKRASGVGEVGRLILSALDVLDVPHWELDFGPPSIGKTVRRPPLRSSLPPPGVPIVLHVNPPMLPLTLLQAPRHLLRKRLMIGYWTWELGTVPTDWRIGASFVHEVWVPSRFTAEAVKAVFQRPVRVVPPPVALAVPELPRADRAVFDLPTDAIIVLVSFNLASSFERKNPLGAIHAFKSAFGSRTDRMLLLKVGNPHHFVRDFERIKSAVAGAPNIRLETREFSRIDNYLLTANSDIVLSLHRAEGLGLIPAEAMLLGKPVIATGWSGNLQFMDGECSALVDYQLVPVRDARQVYDIPGAHWAEPNHEQAVAYLRWLADNPAERAVMGKKGRDAILTRLGVAPLVDAMRGMGLQLPKATPAQGVS